MDLRSGDRDDHTIGPPHPSIGLRRRCLRMFSFQEGNEIFRTWYLEQ